MTDFIFDLQLFGGKGGGSTTVQAYQPTAEEIELMGLQRDYVKSIMPNALSLNNIAWNVLTGNAPQTSAAAQTRQNAVTEEEAKAQAQKARDDYIEDAKKNGTYVDRNKQNNKLSTQIMNGDMTTTEEEADKIYNDKLNELMSGSAQNSAGTAESYNTLGTIPVDYNTLNDAAQSQINTATGGLWENADATRSAADSVGKTMQSLIPYYNAVSDEADGKYGNIGNQYADAGNKAYNRLNSLADGNLPTGYTENMENAINSVLQNTLGSAINSLGNRGVLNSSVTNRAINDIAKSAADVTAGQYQSNIQQAANLTSGAQNAMNTALSGQAGMAAQQAAARNSALDKSQELNQQAFADLLSANEQTNGTYGSLINSATAPITTAAAGQEAAQQPAMNLWNMSLGLNGANTGALAAAAGKGTTTTTTKNSDGGGLWSGIISGAIGAFCFKAGTKISMSNGTEKNIEDIAVGDKILSANGETQTVIKKMKPHKNAQLKIKTDAGKSVTTTDTQPLMKDDGGYIDVKDLAVGTKLKNAGTVISKTIADFDFVYDFETDGDNSYVANGFAAKGGGLPYWEE